MAKRRKGSQKSRFKRAARKCKGQSRRKFRICMRRELKK